MKKVLVCLFIFSSVINNSYADENIIYKDNPAFQGKENQIRIDGGLSIRKQGIEGYQRVNDDGTKSNYTPNLGFGMISYS
jgi:hypothetical protein